MTANKHTRLKDYLKNLDSVLVAFSGGADSSLLLYLAAKVLGKNKVLAVTADSETFPRRELAEAKLFSKKNRLLHETIQTNELNTINQQGNPRNRCYHCKKELFSALKELAQSRGLRHVVEGSNLDDDHDYRPGFKAVQELAILSPLKACGFTKSDVRELSRKLKLPTWDKPAYACLTSRFPYYQKITPAALQQVEAAETFLQKQGFRQCRVRHYGAKARVEVETERLDQLFKQAKVIVHELQNLGFLEVELDPAGYRPGSMN